jgi:abhydrolase domain-containing protein 6
LKRTLPVLDELRRSSSQLQHRALGGLVHRVIRLQLKEAALGELRMPYLESGVGSPLVFLHGFADQKETWSLLAPRLTDRHRVLVPDLPGFGDASPISPEEAAMPSQSQHLARFLEKVGVRQPVHLCGNSMGGGLALQFAADYPERVASLALLSPIGPTVVKSELQEQLERGECALLPKTPEAYEETLAFVFARKPPLPSLFWRHLAVRAAERHERYGAVFYHLVEKMGRWSDQIPALPHPVLLLHGRLDRVVHWETSAAWSERLPNARLEVMEGIGHAPQWEAPRKTLELLRGFFLGA